MFSKNHFGQSNLNLLQNNIAEVEELQADLMEEDLLEHILSLLQDSHVEVGVRYFAGGILAQVTSRPEAWTLDEELRGAILKQLVGGLFYRGFHVTDNKIHLCLFLFSARFHNYMDPTGERNGLLQVSEKQTRHRTERKLGRICRIKCIYSSACSVQHQIKATCCVRLHNIFIHLYEAFLI